MTMNAGATRTATREPLPFRQALLYGWLTVGTLDILDAILFWYFRAQAPPMRILQSVAAGLLGRETATSGGWSTALLGLALHYFIAFVVVTIFFYASRKLRFLVRHPVFWGIVYGLAVYCVMYYVVMPLSHVGWPSKPTLVVLLNNLGIHAFGVGLPSALWARRAG
jgi:uncharacterized membrane protein YagU involved in acid resistance